MADKKKPTRYLTGKVELQAVFSQLRDPSEDKKRVRGPRQKGQYRDKTVIHITRVKQEVAVERLKQVKALLLTGKVPAKAQGGAPATSDATLAKAKGDLTKANNKLKAALAENEELKKKVAELEAQ